MPARRWKMLDNTLYKLKNNKELTIGFFGGSITEGAGASDASRDVLARLGHEVVQGEISGS